MSTDRSVAPEPAPQPTPATNLETNVEAPTAPMRARRRGRGYRLARTVAMIVVLLGASAGLWKGGGTASAGLLGQFPCPSSSGVPGGGGGGQPPLSNLQLVVRAVATDGTVLTKTFPNLPLGFPNAHGAPELTGADLQSVDFDGDGTNDVQVGVGLRTATGATASSGPSAIQRVLAENLRQPVGADGTASIFGIDARVLPVSNASVHDRRVEVGVRFDLDVDGQPTPQELSLAVDGRPRASSTPGLPTDSRLTVAFVTPSGTGPQTTLVAFGQDLRWADRPVDAQPAIPVELAIHRVNQTQTRGYDARVGFDWKDRTPAETGLAVRIFCSPDDPSFHSTTQLGWAGDSLSGATLGLELGYGQGQGQGGTELLTAKATIPRMAERADVILHPDNVSISRSPERDDMTIQLDRLTYAPPSPGAGPHRAAQVSGTVDHVSPTLVAGLLNNGIELGGYGMSCSGSGAPADDLLPQFPLGCTRTTGVSVQQVGFAWQDFLDTEPGANLLVGSGIFETPPAGQHVVYEHTDSLGGRLPISFNRVAVSIGPLRLFRFSGGTGSQGEPAIKTELHSGGTPSPLVFVVHDDLSSSTDRSADTGWRADAKATLTPLPADVSWVAPLDGSQGFDLTADTSTPAALDASLTMRGPAPDQIDLSAAAKIDGPADGGGGLPTHAELRSKRTVADPVAEQTFAWDANTPTKVRLGATYSTAADRAAHQRLRAQASVTVPQNLDISLKRVSSGDDAGALISATAKACNGQTTGCVDEVDAFVTDDAPSADDANLLAPPALPNHDAAVAPAFGDPGSGPVVRFSYLSKQRWGGRLHVKNVALAQYAPGTSPDQPSASGESLCVQSAPDSAALALQLYGALAGGDVAYVNATLSQLPSTVYATIRPSLSRVHIGDVADIGGLSQATLSDGSVGGGGPQSPPPAPDHSTTTKGFYLSDQCWSLPPLQGASDGSQAPGTGARLDAIVRYGNEGELRSLGAIRRLDRQLDGSGKGLGAVTGGLATTGTLSRDPGPSPAPPAPAPPATGGAGGGVSHGGGGKLALQADDRSPDADTQTVVEAKRLPAAGDAPGPDAPARETSPATGTAVDAAPPAAAAPPLTTSPDGPKRPDFGAAADLGGTYAVNTATFAQTSGPGIDVRGKVGADTPAGSGLGLDIRVVETVPKYFAFFPATVKSCAPPAPPAPLTATTGVLAQARLVNPISQTGPYPACESKPSYEADSRYQIDFATRSSLSSLGELSADLFVDRYRVEGRIGNVPANLAGSIFLQRNQRLPWTDVKVSLKGKEALKDVAVEVFDALQIAAVGPAVSHPQPAPGTPPEYKCDQVPGLCDRDPRPSPGGSPPVFPDPANQVPNYRLGFANVTDHLTVVGQLRDNETSRFAPLSYSDTSACPTGSFRSGGQHLGYAHLDLDLKSQATSVTITKRDGLDNSVTRESQGTDLAPGSGSGPMKYSLSDLPVSTGITVKADKPVNGSLRVRVDNVQVNRESDHSYALWNHVNVGICVDLDFPFELAMYGVTDVRLGASGAEFGIDLSKNDLDHGALANFYVHERTRSGGDAQGAQFAYRKTGIDFTWATSGPGDDLNEEQSGPFTKPVRLQSNEPLCEMDHHYYDTNDHEWKVDKQMTTMCYWPGASSGGDNPGWNQANMVSANNSWTRPMADIGNYRRLSFMADLLFTDSFLSGLVEHDSYGPVDPIGPGNIIFRNVAHLGVLPMDFRMPSLTNTPTQSSGVTEHAVATGRAADGTTYTESDNVEFFTDATHGSFESGPENIQGLVARYPNGQIRWIHNSIRRVALFSVSAFSLTVNPDGTITGWSGWAQQPSPPQGYMQTGTTTLDPSGTKVS